MPGPLAITLLPADDHNGRMAAATLLETAFADGGRYARSRILTQLSPEVPPFYRHAFIARREGDIVGVGCLKAADWASDTHILHLSAVTEAARGQGIARDLVCARIAWVREHFDCGRLLVSTAHTRRFVRLGFHSVGKHAAGERRLMMMEFSR